MSTQEGACTTLHRQKPGLRIEPRGFETTVQQSSAPPHRVEQYHQTDLLSVFVSSSLQVIFHSIYCAFAVERWCMLHMYSRTSYQLVQCADPLTVILLLDRIQNVPARALVDRKPRGRLHLSGMLVGNARHWVCG